MINSDLGWSLLVAVIVTLLFDQGTKAVALWGLSANPLRLAPGIRLILTHNNKGGMLGISTGAAATMTFAAVVGILILISTKTLLTPLRVAGMGLMIGGALSNLLDRLARGAVIDFIGVWRWATFNFADIALCIGFALTLASIL